MKRQSVEIDKSWFFSSGDALFNIADITALLKQPTQVIVHLGSTTIKMDVYSDKERDSLFNLIKKFIIDYRAGANKYRNEYKSQLETMVKLQKKAVEVK